MRGEFPDVVSKAGIRQNVSTWSQFAQSFTIAVDEYFYRHIERRISN